MEDETRSKDEFMATLGHELRNPLAILRTASQILQMDGASDVEIKAAAQIIARQVQVVTRLVDDLLDTERIAHGKLHLEVRPVDLREIVTTTLDTRRADAQRRHQSLTVQLTSDPVVVAADPMRLEQVVSNLVDNAVKYTPDAGHISVAVQAGDDEAIIVVEDDGAGIPIEQAETIFEPFVQLSESRNAARGGMGLGLSLVRRLTELHGGKVEVSSRGAGCGSRFAVRLPLQRPTARSQPQA